MDMNIRAISKMWVKMESPNAPVIRSVLGETAEKVHLTIFDTFGHMVHETILQGQPSGELNGESYYDYAWDGPKLKGIYTAVVDGETKESRVRGKTTFAVMGEHNETK